MQSLILAIAAIVAFANGLSGPFMLDDHAFFTYEIKDVRNVPKYFIPQAYRSDQIKNVPHGQPNFYYRPFAKLLPSVSYALFGQKTFFYHLFNLTLFVLAGFLLYRFLMETGVLGHRGAFLAGLIYIIHPINGVVVNYITASVFAAQVVLMIGSLLALWSAVDSRQSAVGRQPSADENLLTADGQRLTSRDPKVFGLWSLVFFILALLCHETAVLLPLYAACLLYIWGPVAGITSPLRFCLRHTWSLWAVAAGWLVFRSFYASLGDGLIAKFGRFEMGPWEYAASVVKLVFWYLSKLIVPWDIVLIWTTPVVRADEVFIWIFLGFLLIALWALGMIRIQDRTIRLGLGWLGAGFLPLPLMCLFQPTHGPMIEPHWFVFSVIGFFICAGRVLETLKPAAFKITAGLVLTALIVTGWRHNHLWADEARYAHYWSQVAPSNKAVWFHLGEIYFHQRRFGEAAGYYERSIRKTYQDYLAYQRMGLAYFQMKDFQRAEINFMVSLRLEPRQPGIRERLNWIEQKLKSQRPGF